MTSQHPSRMHHGTIDTPTNSRCCGFLLRNSVLVSPLWETLASVAKRLSWWVSEWFGEWVCLCMKEMKKIKFCEWTCVHFIGFSLTNGSSAPRGTPNIETWRNLTMKEGFYFIGWFETLLLLNSLYGVLDISFWHNTCQFMGWIV